MSKIHKIGQGQGGAWVSAGYYVISASGNLILVPPNGEMKSGSVLATQSDIDAFTAAEAARNAPQVEASVADQPVEAFVESIEIDAPIADDRD